MKITVNEQSLENIQDKGIVRVVLEQTKVSQLNVDENGIRTLSFGIGEKGKLNQRKFVNVIRKLVITAKAQKIKRLATNFSDWTWGHLNIDNKELAQILVENLVMANFEFIKYKTIPEDKENMLDEVIVCGINDDNIKQGVAKGEIIAKEVNESRLLANCPGGVMTPKLLAESAQKAAEATGLKVSVLGAAEIKELGMGALLGVARGSKNEPRFIVMEYLPNEGEQPIVLVGKGITFDSGGLSLKPAEFMLDMHLDMSGAAAVIHTLVAAVKLGVKKNMVALIPAAENMLSGESYRPGDILTSLSGLNIEVLNTDAEGRIILADGLAYAKKYNPKLVVDVATLTGAAMVALGKRASAIFSKDDEILKKAQKWGEISGDYVWPLPLWEEYEQEIKANFGDWANTGKDRYGGSITAATFLYQFAKDYPWLHIDIAPRMLPAEGDNLAKGFTGAPVRLLVKLLEEY